MVEKFLLNLIFLKTYKWCYYLTWVTNSFSQIRLSQGFGEIIGLNCPKLQIIALAETDFSSSSVQLLNPVSFLCSILHSHFIIVIFFLLLEYVLKSNVLEWIHFFFIQLNCHNFCTSYITTPFNNWWEPENLKQKKLTGLIGQDNSRELGRNLHKVLRNGKRMPIYFIITVIFQIPSHAEN